MTFCLSSGPRSCRVQARVNSGVKGPGSTWSSACIACTPLAMAVLKIIRAPASGSALACGGAPLTGLRLGRGQLSLRLAFIIALCTYEESYAWYSHGSCVKDQENVKTWFQLSVSKDCLQDSWKDGCARKELFSTSNGETPLQARNTIQQNERG